MAMAAQDSDAALDVIALLRAANRGDDGGVAVLAASASPRTLAAMAGAFAEALRLVAGLMGYPEDQAGAVVEATAARLLRAELDALAGG